jgi:phosphotransacetylase
MRIRNIQKKTEDTYNSEECEEDMTLKHGTGKYEQVLIKCKNLDPVPTAVAHPCEKTALAGAIEAAQEGLIRPILVGPASKIESIAKAAQIDLGKSEIVDAPHSHASAAKAVELVRKGEAELLMKGSLHTDELMSAIVAREGGLRTGRRISRFQRGRPKRCRQENCR